MLLKILIVGGLVVGLMVGLRDGRLMARAGLLSSCNAVLVNGSPDPALQSCSKGRLDGFPDLTNKSCRRIAVHPEREVWQCEAPIVSSQVPRG